MRIEHGRLEEIKRINLPEYLSENGLNFKKSFNGSFLASCPFHRDRTPSFHVNLRGSTWLWHCFGCGKGGDILKYVMLREEIGFNEAVEKLTGPGEVTDKNGKEEISYRPSSMSTDLEIYPGEAVPARILKVLGKVGEYYHNTFKENKEAQGYLKKRGLLNPELIERYRIGFCDGSLPKDRGIRSELTEIGIINRMGSEHFFNCVVFPIEDGNGNIVSMYGRHIYQKRHLYLPGNHRGLFNWAYAKGKSRIYLTESIIDALSLIEMGLHETVALYGTNGFTEDHRRLVSDPALREVYFCFDNDEAGERAVKKHSERISDKGLVMMKVASLNGTKDANAFLLAGKGKEEFLGKVEEIKCERGLFDARRKEISFKVKEGEGEVTFTKGDLSYRIRGINFSRVGTFKVTVKIENPEGYHLDTFDLYSAKARQSFTKQVYKLMGLDEGVIGRDLGEMVDYLEGMQARVLEKGIEEKKAVMSEAERQEATAYLKSPELIGKILRDAGKCGYVGEEKNFLLGYLVSISRKLKNPLALMIISQSGAGKTELQDKILSFTPPEDFMKLTRLTDQSLFYQERDALVHKLVAIEEEEGASGAGYSIRHLLSTNSLTTMTTVKDEMTGRMKAVSHEVEGPISMMITTTNSEINYETYNRFLIVTVDESRRQTKAILIIQRHLETLEGIVKKRNYEKLQRLHQNMQRLLEPLEVVNPYAEKMNFTDSLLRARREQKKYHSIIKAVALLRQYQKEIKIGNDGKETFKYIEADKIDIKIANEITKEFILRGLDEMSPQGRKLLKIIKEMVVETAKKEEVEEDEVVFSIRELREYSGWSDYQLRKQIAELDRLEYLIPVSGSNGKRFTYKLMWDGTERGEEALGLIDPDHL